MARLLALIQGAGIFAAMSCAGLTALSAQMAATPAAPAPPAVAPNAAPAKPAPLDDYYIRYGKILKPNEQPGYPFKLNLPFPGTVGEVRVPSKEELNMRDKLEQLAVLSDDEIRTQLFKWPAFAKMSLNDEATMLQRIQSFRDYRRKMAGDAAHRLGLLTLTPAQMQKFEKDYWDEKLKMDRQLAQQLEGPYKAAQQKLNEDLYREFSSPGGLPPVPPPASVTASPNPALAH